jgi:hypothetical protein
MIRDILTKISGLSGGQIDKIALWTFALVVATLLLWWIARKQLGGINRTAKADFSNKFDDNFFNKTTRTLVMLFDYDALTFNRSDISYGVNIKGKPFFYFDINDEIIEQFKISPDEKKYLLEKKIFTAYEIDDYLLGYFEDIGSFEKDGLLHIRDVYNRFDIYLDSIWNNQEIQNYISTVRDNENDGEDIYEDFDYIYKKCDSYGNAKASGDFMLWWSIKWRFTNRCYNPSIKTLKKYFKKLHLNKVTFRKRHSK